MIYDIRNKEEYINKRMYYIDIIRGFLNIFLKCVFYICVCVKERKKDYPGLLNFHIKCDLMETLHKLTEDIIFLSH